MKLINTRDKSLKRYLFKTTTNRKNSMQVTYNNRLITQPSINRMKDNIVKVHPAATSEIILDNTIFRLVLGGSDDLVPE